MRVGGTPGDANSGARVRINDPLAKFSKGDSPDKRFTIDEDNPTVRPRPATRCASRAPTRGPADDPYCPQRNRPKDTSGAFVTTYTYPDAPSVAGQPPDPRLPAPFEMGDYIIYAGTLVADPRAGAQGQPPRHIHSTPTARRPPRPETRTSRRTRSLRASGSSPGRVHARLCGDRRDADGDGRLEHADLSPRGHAAHPRRRVHHRPDARSAAARPRSTSTRWTSTHARASRRTGCG